jgi:hypothetical protein
MKNQAKVSVTLKEIKKYKALDDEYFYRNLAKSLIEGMELEELKKLIVFKKERVVYREEEMEYTATVILP